MSDIDYVIAALYNKGVRLWRNGDQLTYTAPRGVLMTEDISRLKERKLEIIQFLIASSSAADSPLAVMPRSPSEPIPLTFVQQTIWKEFSTVGMQFNRRTLANAIRIFGTLDLAVMRAAFSSVVQQHEILRARIVPRTETATHELVCESACALDVVDLMNRGSNPEERLRGTVEDFVNQSCDMTVGPLFAARVVRVGNCDNVLVVTLDHIIADATSLGIVFRELLTNYLSAIRDLRRPLSREAIQFADYAIREKKSDPLWTEMHGVFWQKKLCGASRSRIAANDGVTDRKRLRFLQISFALGKELSDGLRNIARRERTTLVMVVLAAYFASVSRWCKSWDITIGFVSDGRHRQELQNAVGIFTYVLYLRVYLLDTDTFASLLQGVIREYQTSYKHQDFGRMALAWQSVEYTKNTTFNWNPRGRPVGADEGDSAVGSNIRDAGITLRPFRFSRPAADVEWNDRIAKIEWEPTVTFSELADGIAGVLCYREDRSTASTMENFILNFRQMANQLAEFPDGRLI